MLMTMQRTGHYGLLVAVQSSLVNAARQRSGARYRRKLGLAVTVGRLLDVKETFFYDEPARHPGLWCSALSSTPRCPATSLKEQGDCIMISPAILHRVPTTARTVAFTFDDGPNPVYTPQLLDIFRHARGKATFFVIGQQIDAHPATAAAVHTAGHQLGNQTFTHPRLCSLHQLPCAQNSSDRRADPGPHRRACAYISSAVPGHE